MSKRTIIQADAIDWMRSHGEQFGTVITSPPDASEINLPPEQWEGWFFNAVSLCMACARSGCPAIFYVTDRKADSRLYSKPSIIFKAAELMDFVPVWHKICLRRDVNKTDLMRPTFTHLMAFALRGKTKPGTATPDVIYRGSTLYPNGMGLNACVVAMRYALGFVAPVLDPFCGRGTVLAVADTFGIPCTGIDIDAGQCDEARKLIIDPIPYQV